MSKVSDEYDLNIYINAFHNIYHEWILGSENTKIFTTIMCVAVHVSALVHHEKDLTVRCLSSSNMSKEIAHVFRVKDLVFAVVKIDNEDFSVPNEC